MNNLSVGRRTFLGLSVGSIAAAMAPSALAAGRQTPFDVASAALSRCRDRVAVRDVVAVADFSLRSADKRFHLVDMKSGAVESFLVAHGRGSDPAHRGWLSRFSNDPGSYCTSEGAYVTGDYYVGAHGRSLRLSGLDPSNCNAGPRAIVVHSARYVSEALVRETGVLGRSEGCFAVADEDIAHVLGRMGPGRLLVAGIY